MEQLNGQTTGLDEIEQMLDSHIEALYILTGSLDQSQAPNYQIHERATVIRQWWGFHTEPPKQEVFWTVNTRTQAGVEGKVFTLARGPAEAMEKVKKYFADNHQEALEQCNDDKERAYLGPNPLIEVVSAIWEATFIP